MITISAGNLEYLLKNGVVDVRMVMVPAGTATQINIGAYNILDGTFSLKRDSMSGREFNIGQAIASELRFTLINDEGQFDGITFEGAQITLLATIGSTEYQIGIYTVDERPKRKNLMMVRALDNMARFDRLVEDNLQVWSGLVSNLLLGICNRVNITRIPPGVSLDYTISVTEDNPIFKGRTYRDVIKWIAVLTGTNAIMDNQGRLRFKEPFDTEIIIPERAVVDLVMAESPIEITGVEYVEPATSELVDDERIEVPEIRHLVGDDGYVIDVSDNPLFAAMNETDMTNALAGVGSVVNGFQYMPIGSLTTLSLPHIEPNDIIHIGKYNYDYFEGDEDNDSEVIETLVSSTPVFVTNHTWSAGGGSHIVAVGEPEIQKGYATGDVLTPAQKEQITRIIERHTNRAQDQTVSGYLEAQLNLHREIASALGFYQTQYIDAQGRVTVYTHDMEDIEDSMYIEFKGGPGGYAWTTTGWNNGNPDWQYGVTKDGSMVMQIIDAVKIRAEQIVVSSGGTTLDSILGSGENLFERTSLEQGTLTSSLPVGTEYDGTKSYTTTRLRTNKPIKTSGNFVANIYSDHQYLIYKYDADKKLLGRMVANQSGEYKSSAEYVGIVIRNVAGTKITPAEASEIKFKIERGTEGSGYSLAQSDITDAVTLISEGAAAFVKYTDVDGSSSATVIDGGNIKADTITADKLNVTSLEAIAAKIGNWTIGAGGRLVATGTGSANVYLAPYLSGFDYVFKAADTAGNTTFGVKKNGDVEVSGKVIVDDGEVGGWSITGGASARIGSASGNAFIYLAPYHSSFTYLISATDANGIRRFSVSKDGKLYARNIDVVGKIQASTGRIGPLQVSNTGLTFTGANKFQITTAGNLRARNVDLSGNFRGTAQWDTTGSSRIYARGAWYNVHWVSLSGYWCLVLGDPVSPPALPTPGGPGSNEYPY